MLQYVHLCDNSDWCFYSIQEALLCSLIPRPHTVRVWVQFLVQELQRIEPDFVPGLNIQQPTMRKRDQLGSGGNGQVFKFPIGRQELAVKWVRR